MNYRNNFLCLYIYVYNIKCIYISFKKIEEIKLFSSIILKIVEIK